MLRSLICLLGFLFLAPLAVSAEEADPPFPYAPYRLNLKEYNLFLKEKARAELFVTQATPTNGSSVLSEKGLELTVTFNRPVDPKTLPPLNEKWSMETPFGPLDSSNLSEYGEFHYTNLPVSRDGISYPPNTLSLQLNDTSLLALDEPLHWSLHLQSAPTDHLGRVSVDHLDLEPYVAWTFRLDPQERLSPFEGGHYLRLVSEENLEVEEFFSPLLFDFSKDGDRFLLTFTEGKAPNTLPYRTKVLSLRLPLKSLISEAPVELPLNQIEFTLEEFLYPDTLPPQQASFEMESRRWLASDGTVWVGPLESNFRVVRLKLTLQEQDIEDGESKTLEGFVYIRE